MWGLILGCFKLGILKVIGRAARLPQLRTDMFCSVVIFHAFLFSFSEDDLNSIMSPNYLYWPLNFALKLVCICETVILFFPRSLRPFILEIALLANEPNYLELLIFRACKLFRMTHRAICDLILFLPAFGAPDNDYPIIDSIIQLSQLSRKLLVVECCTLLQSCLY